MFKENVIQFFNNAAEHWDDTLCKNPEIINMILDNATVTSGKDILDVACGTGIMIPDYLDRNVNSVTAIDISPEMVKIAQSKFPQENVKIICGDIETENFEQKFDCIVVYNAFPHFPDPEKLIKTLIAHLNPGGTLTVAHGMSREKLAQHHAGAARNVSVNLIHEDELASIFETGLTVTCKISNDQMYQVVGVK